jgi:hypothetical protein
VLRRDMVVRLDATERPFGGCLATEARRKVGLFAGASRMRFAQASQGEAMHWRLKASHGVVRAIHRIVR